MSLNPTAVTRQVDPAGDSIKTFQDGTGQHVQAVVQVDAEGALPGPAVRIATAGNITYVGKAAIGALPSAPVWQIQRLDETSGLVLTWADGDPSYNNVWDNRASLTYL